MPDRYSARTWGAETPERSSLLRTLAESATLRYPRLIENVDRVDLDDPDGLTDEERETVELYPAAIGYTKAIHAAAGWLAAFCRGDDDLPEHDGDYHGAAYDPDY